MLPFGSFFGISKPMLGGPSAVALLVALAFALLLADPAGASVPPQIESRFESADSGLEGWTVVGDPASGYPRHVATGGNPGGFARTVDGGRGATMYWSAPGKFLGDKSAYYGGILGFDLRQSAVDRQFNAVEVELTGGGLRLTLDFSHPQTG